MDGEICCHVSRIRLTLLANDQALLEDVTLDLGTGAAHGDLGEVCNSESTSVESVQ